MAKNKSRNVNLHWFVCEWNDVYIIHSSIYMRRFPETKYVYSTGDFRSTWTVIYNPKTNSYKHVIKK
jgi:hypothetical protein